MKLPFQKMGAVLPALWNDRVTIYGVVNQQDEDGFDDSVDAVIVRDEPAKVVLRGQKQSDQSFFGTDAYDAKLILRNGIHIPAGADIIATDVNGRTTRYKRASAGYTGYVSHQEVAMVRDEKAKEVANNGLL